MTISADFWELPQPQLTSSITDKIEKNFYLRCPPEKRPWFMRESDMNVSLTISGTSSSVSSSPNKHAEAGDVQNQKHEYKPDTEKVCGSRVPNYRHEFVISSA